MQSEILSRAMEALGAMRSGSEEGLARNGR